VAAIAVGKVLLSTLKSLVQLKMTTRQTRAEWATVPVGVDMLILPNTVKQNTEHCDLNHSFDRCRGACIRESTRGIFANSVI
jgi:hypothetical protein